MNRRVLAASLGLAIVGCAQHEQSVQSQAARSLPPVGLDPIPSIHDTINGGLRGSSQDVRLAGRAPDPTRPMPPGGAAPAEHEPGAQPDPIAIAEAAPGAEAGASGEAGKPVRAGRPAPFASRSPGRPRPRTGEATSIASDEPPKAEPSAEALPEVAEAENGPEAEPQPGASSDSNVATTHALPDPMPEAMPELSAADKPTDKPAADRPTDQKADAPVAFEAVPSPAESEPVPVPDPKPADAKAGAKVAEGNRPTPSPEPTPAGVAGLTADAPVSASDMPKLPDAGPVPTIPAGSDPLQTAQPAASQPAPVEPEAAAPPKPTDPPAAQPIELPPLGGDPMPAETPAPTEPAPALPEALPELPSAPAAPATSQPTPAQAPVPAPAAVPAVTEPQAGPDTPAPTDLPPLPQAAPMSEQDLPQLPDPGAGAPPSAGQGEMPPLPESAPPGDLPPLPAATPPADLPPLPNGQSANRPAKPSARSPQVAMTARMQSPAAPDPQPQQAPPLVRAPEPPRRDPAVRVASAEPTAARTPIRSVATPQYSEVMARVGDEVITLKQLRSSCREWTQKHVPAGQHLSPDDKNQILRMVLDNLIDQTLALQEARRLMKQAKQWDKFKESIQAVWLDEEVPSLLRRHHVENEYELKAKLAEAGQSYDEMRESYCQNRMAREFVMMKIHSKLTVDLPGMRDYYNAHLKDFDRPAQVTWREIVVEVAKHPSRAEARRKAQGLLDQVRHGEDFAAVAKASSEGATAREGGLWTISPGSYAVPAVNEALASMAPKQVSAILEGPTSFHIVRLEESRKAGPARFDEVQDQIRDVLFERAFKRETEGLMAKLREKTLITTKLDNPEAFASETPARSDGTRASQLR